MDYQHGICLFQRRFIDIKESNKQLFLRISKCNEVVISVLDNINSQFAIKKISPTSYHAYTNKLFHIQTSIRNASVDTKMRMMKRHISITKCEKKIDELLEVICCSDVRILFNWITSGEWQKCIPIYQESILAEKIDFVEKNFIPRRFSKSCDENIDNVIESPDEHIRFRVIDNETQIIFDNILEEEQYILYGHFKGDSIHCARLYKFYNDKYNELCSMMNNKHIPKEFRDKFLEQMRTDDILGKDSNDNTSVVSLAYNNAKEYKNMPLNILISHFMSGNIELKTYMLTLLLLYDINTKYIATILFDFILNEDQSAHMAHELYCNMHWSIQKEFEYSYKAMTSKMKTINSMDKIPYEKRVLISSASEEAKEKAYDKIKSANSPEGGSKAQQWLDGFLKIPFSKYKSHSIIDNLSMFKIKIDGLMLKMDLVESYKNLKKSPYETSYKIDILINKLKKHLSKIDFNGLSVSVLEIENNVIDDEKKSTSPILSNLMTLANNISSRSSLSDDNSDNSSSSMYDERISIINGTLQKRRTHKTVSLNLFNDLNDDFSDKRNRLTEFFTEKTLYKELSTLCKEWDNYNNEKRKYIENIKTTLDSVCYGHHEAKNEIQRLVGQWVNGSTDGTIIGIEGPPGNGKTTLAKMGISKCLIDTDGSARPFGMIALGGSSNGSTLVGHNFTYVGSTWGKILDIVISSKCLNPIIYIDEVDKISRTEHGREITGILTHLTDSTQNDHFEDRYFSGIPLDLSKSIIIMSFNDRSLIDPILRDRMHIIKTKPLTTPDKIIIINDYLLPTILENVGFTNKDIIIKPKTCKYLIETYTYEAGVRKVKELLYEIIREFNLKLISKTTNNRFPYEISEKYIDEVLLKKDKVHRKLIHCEPRVGLINGLFATTSGVGGLTTIEVFRTHSNTFLDLILTGSQGDVMKESIKCARTIAWNLLPTEVKDKFKNCSDKENNKEKHESFALHVHTPECSTPKDGPSAGAAITLAILSQLSKVPIRNDIAMTGEIDLNGNVTMIGGLQSKLNGALSAGVKKVLIPYDNKKDLDEIISEKKITEISDKKKDFTVLTVKNIFEMIPHVFVENELKFVNYL